MLSPESRLLIVEFLEDMPTSDVCSLALTISKNNLQSFSREDALNIICQHSENVESVFEKRRIKKSYLCNFLHKNNVSIVHTWDKPALIRKTIEFWNSQLVSKQTTVGPNISVSNYYETFSYKFCEWFYSLLNDDDPTKLGPEHFFIDSHVEIVIMNNDSSNIIEANTSTDIARIFFDLHTQYSLKFLPNLNSDALKFKTDVHGQVILLVCGTLHVRNSSQVIGVFEQMFLLIRDITDNENWKIRTCQINLKSSNSTEPAVLSANTSQMICS